MLCQQLQACHLSTGDLFRAAQCQKAPSEALSKALEAMRRGELVSDELVMSMVRERSHCLHCQGGFLLDGVPRTLAQAMSLRELLQEQQVELDGVISYELPLEEIVQRLGGRRTCGVCKAVFHVASRPPKREGICDRCGGHLVQRDDDKPEAVRVRMASYLESTQPLIEYYSEQRLLVPIEANGSPAEILERTLAALTPRVQRPHFAQQAKVC
jgi:adenylate kinase